MDWQELTALAVVVVTAAAFGWNVVRFRRRPIRTRVGCHCDGGSLPGYSMTFHARRGEQPKVIIKAR